MDFSSVYIIVAMDFGSIYDVMLQYVREYLPGLEALKRLVPFAVLYCFTNVLMEVGRCSEVLL